jgi:superfamily II DNA or RNA helicase
MTADDAGAGKTIMAGLLIRELELRGLAERILIVCPANLSFQWQRELKEKFDAKILVLKGGDIRDQFGVNQWLEQKKIITSLDLAKRKEILHGLRQVHWDFVIVDEAHRMSAADETHKSLRYKLGELLRDTSDHMILLTATPHKGDPLNFSLAPLVAGQQCQERQSKAASHATRYCKEEAKAGKAKMRPAVRNSPHRVGNSRGTDHLRRCSSSEAAAHASVRTRG